MSPETRITVLALGGNAILRRNQQGTFQEQYENVRSTAAQIATLVDEGLRIVIVHGNGPQIGATVIRHEMGRARVPPLPLHACGAETQGFLGYMIQQCLQDELSERGSSKPVATIVTQVLVDPNDPAFKHPSKPIGPFYTKDQRDAILKDRKDLTIEEDSGRGYRRLVPSPDPIAVIEHRAIQVLVDNESIVIACGGGGIPVIRQGRELEGVEAVIDKDLASERLATSIHADNLVILTDVEGAYLSYGKPEQQLLSKVNRDELEKYARKGSFATGSMGPKVEAAIRFLRSGGKRAVIANLRDLGGAIEGSAGTQVRN
ncbi:MAG TPA: carbamate kinase [Candidatus Bathyarchaeia archaeon]|nr:carbamate kinase [Candidatus Bathyarchaeia archaeon]